MNFSLQIDQDFLSTCSPIYSVTFLIKYPQFFTLHACGQSKRSSWFPGSDGPSSSHCSKFESKPMVGNSCSEYHSWFYFYLLKYHIIVEWKIVLYMIKWTLLYIWFFKVGSISKTRNLFVRPACSNGLQIEFKKVEVFWALHPCGWHGKSS